LIHSKRRSEQHLIDADGQALLRARLPRQWVLHEYRPDYGIDFVLETFGIPSSRAATGTTYEAMGEHVFIQLKSARSCQPALTPVFARTNVEKGPEVVNPQALVSEVLTVPFALDTPELVTIDRMGVALPVLLIVADLEHSHCYFVCLSDYIDKILVPRFDAYWSTSRRVVHVPVRNEIGDAVIGRTALHWYAKRAKLVGAFQRFAYQRAELENAISEGASDTMRLALHFATRILRYDFWDDLQMWAPVSELAADLRRFLARGASLARTTDASGHLRGPQASATATAADVEEILGLWRRLTLLARIHEDVAREWFLPTALGHSAS
jgi:hypothetical protein